MERRIVTEGFVGDLLACARDLGVDPAPYLAEAGLPADPRGPITDAAFGRLWWGIAQAAGDEFLGLGARPMRPGAFALMCQAMLHAGSLERALRRGLRFLAVVLDAPAGSLQLRGGEVEITLSAAPGPRPAFAYRTFWLILMGAACWLVGRRIPLRALDFAGAAPAGRRDCLTFFGAPVRFDRAQTRLVFDAAYLKLPTIRSEAALRGFLRAAPGNLLVRYRAEAGMAARVRAHLAARPPADWPGFEALAAALELSPATLRRQLRADGQSFAALKDELRAVIAERLLREGRLSVAQVSAELGYSEPSAFHRAFTKWTGQSPGALRAAARG